MFYIGHAGSVENDLRKAMHSVGDQVIGIWRGGGSCSFDVRTQSYDTTFKIYQQFENCHKQTDQKAICGTSKEILLEARSLVACVLLTDGRRGTTGNVEGIYTKPRQANLASLGALSISHQAYSLWLISYGRRISRCSLKTQLS